MRQGDTVIFIEDEHPRDRARRKNKKWKNKHPNRPINKVGHLDTVDKVTGKKVKFKKDKKADFDRDDGKELPSSRNQRRKDGEPARKALIIPPDFFRTSIRGLQFDIDHIQLDDGTIAMLEEYDKTVRQSRGEVVERRGR